MFPASHPVNAGAKTLMPMGPDVFVPYVVTSPKEELLACRETAWFGCSLNCSPVYDISGPDVATLMNKVTVNRDYSKLKVGGSRHSLFCNERGQLLADGVLMRREENLYRSYWLAPVLAYYVDTMGLDVKGEWVTDEFFFQIDGPKSLEIMEKASHEDLHDLKFARHKNITVAGVPVAIHRLGMSGCLAYEMHGPMDQADVFFQAVLDAGEEYGIKRLGQAEYCRNHTQGGYPNQNVHFMFPYQTSGEGLAEYTKDSMFGLMPAFGSASDDIENAFVTPFDVNWDYLINWDHDFIGKDALLAIKDNPPRTSITLEWDAQDVAAVYATQFMGKDVTPVDELNPLGDGGEQPFVMSKVLDADGNMVGVASGRCTDYYHQRMISLAFVDRDQAELGNELVVLWGTDPSNQMEIKAKVAEFPYYNEMRNETFDVEQIPHPEF